MTGGAGFLGGHLVRALCAAGHAVRVLDDLSTGSRARLAGLKLELLQADVRNPAAVRRAVEGMEVVFHLAGIAVPSSPSGQERVAHAEEVNVGGALNLLRAAGEVPLRRVVVAGSGAVYGRPVAHVLHEELGAAPTTLDGVQRLAVEQYARIYHQLHRVPAVVLRLFRCFGPGERWEGDEVPLVPRLCRAALEGRAPPLTGNGLQTRDLVHVDNAVAGLLAAGFTAGVDGGVYNVASGESVPVVEVWRRLAELAGFHGDAPEPFYLPLQRHEPPQVRVSIARARRDLKYAPSVSLRDGLRRTFEFYRERFRSADNGWFTPSERTSPRPIQSGAARPSSMLRRPAGPTAAAGPSGPLRPLPRPPRAVPPPREEVIELSPADLEEEDEACLQA